LNQQNEKKVEGECARGGETLIRTPGKNLVSSPRDNKL